MKPISITYEEFLMLNPCWLDDASKYEIMEEIGRSKERWTALDVMSINHKEVSDRDKLWVILHGNLMYEEQVRKVLSITVQNVVDRILSDFNKMANNKTKAAFNEVLDIIGFKTCLATFYKSMSPVIDDKPSEDYIMELLNINVNESMTMINLDTELISLIRNPKYTEIFKKYSKPSITNAQKFIRKCFYKIEATISMIRKSKSIFTINDGVDKDMIIAHLITFKDILNTLLNKSSITEILYSIGVGVMPFRLAYIPEDRDKPFDDCVLIALSAITTVIKEDEQSTDVKENKQ